jgi:hypothetical protein
MLLGHNLAGDMLLHPAELLLGGGALLDDFAAAGGGLLLLDLAVHFRTLFCRSLSSIIKNGRRHTTQPTNTMNTRINVQLNAALCEKSGTKKNIIYITRSRACAQLVRHGVGTNQFARPISQVAVGARSSPGHRKREKTFQRGGRRVPFAAVAVSAFCHERPQPSSADGGAMFWPCRRPPPPQPP